MTNRWPFNRGETLALVAIVIALVGQIPDWVGLGETLGFEPALLLAYAELVQRVLGVVVVSAAALIVVSLIRRFRGQVMRPFKWLGGVGKRFYLWVLWNLVVRPGRDHWGVVVSVEADEEAEEMDAELWSALAKLSKDAVQVLEVILYKYHPTAERTVALRPFFVPLEPETIRGKDKRVTLACDELMMRRFLAGYEKYVGAYGNKTVVTLAPGLPDGVVLKMLEWVEDELMARGIPLRRFREPPVPPPPEPPPSEKVRM